MPRALLPPWPARRCVDDGSARALMNAAVRSAVGNVARNVARNAVVSAVNVVRPERSVRLGAHRAVSALKAAAHRVTMHGVVVRIPAARRGKADRAVALHVAVSEPVARDAISATDRPASVRIARVNGHSAASA